MRAEETAMNLAKAQHELQNETAKREAARAAQFDAELRAQVSHIWGASLALLAFASQPLFDWQARAKIHHRLAVELDEVRSALRASQDETVSLQKGIAAAKTQAQHEIVQVTHARTLLIERAQHEAEVANAAMAEEVTQAAELQTLKSAKKASDVLLVQMQSEISQLNGTKSRDQRRLDQLCHQLSEAEAAQSESANQAKKFIAIAEAEEQAHHDAICHEQRRLLQLESDFKLQAEQEQAAITQAAAKAANSVSTTLAKLEAEVEVERAGRQQQEKVCARQLEHIAILQAAAEQNQSCLHQLQRTETEASEAISRALRTEAGLKIQVATEQRLRDQERAEHAATTANHELHCQHLTVVHQEALSALRNLMSMAQHREVQALETSMRLDHEKEMAVALLEAKNERLAAIQSAKEEIAASESQRREELEQTLKQTTVVLEQALESQQSSTAVAEARMKSAEEALAMGRQRGEAEVAQLQRSLELTAVEMTAAQQALRTELEQEAAQAAAHKIAQLQAAQQAQLEQRVTDVKRTMRLESVEKECSAQAQRINTLQTLFDDVDAHLLLEKNRSAVLREEIEEKQKQQEIEQKVREKLAQRKALQVPGLVTNNIKQHAGTDPPLSSALASDGGVQAEHRAASTLLPAGNRTPLSLVNSVRNTPISLSDILSKDRRTQNSTSTRHGSAITSARKSLSALKSMSHQGVQLVQQLERADGFHADGGGRVLFSESDDDTHANGGRLRANHSGNESGVDGTSPLPVIAKHHAHTSRDLAVVMRT